VAVASRSLRTLRALRWMESGLEAKRHECSSMVCRVPRGQQNSKSHIVYVPPAPPPPLLLLLLLDAEKTDQ